MARTRTKDKTRGDQVVFLLKKTEDQEIIDFINKQSTIVDSLRHLIEIANEINGGIVNLGKNLPSDRDKEWTQNHVTRLAVEYIIRNNIDVSNYTSQGFFPRNYQSEVTNLDEQRKIVQADRDRAEEQQRLQEEATKEREEQQRKLAEERAEKEREEQEQKRKQEEAQNNSNEQLLALQKQVAELLAAQKANTSQNAGITDSISRTSVEEDIPNNNTDEENESKQAAIQAQLADIDPSDF